MTSPLGVDLGVSKSGLFIFIDKNLDWIILP